MQAAPLELVERLYPGSPESILVEVAALDETLDQVALVGHNPALAQLASQLAGEVVDLKTADMVWLQWEGSWKDLGNGAHVTPIPRPD